MEPKAPANPVSAYMFNFLSFVPEKQICTLGCLARAIDGPAHHGR